MQSTTFRKLTVTSNHTYGAPWSGPYSVDRIFSQSLSETKRKESSDTGKFIPGVYRVNPYVVSKQIYALSSVNVTQAWTASGWTYKYTDSGPLGLKAAASISSLPPPSSTDSLKKRALQKALAKLGKSDVGLGENLGELRETIEMLRSPFKGLRDFLFNRNYHNLGLLQKIEHFSNTGRWVVPRKKGHGRPLIYEGRKAAEVAASSWLELRYGLMPLVWAIGSVMDLVQEKVSAHDPNRIRSVRAKVSLSENFEKALTPYSYHKFSYNPHLIVQDELTAYASVQFRQKEPFGVLSKLGLDPRFVPELVWELTRLSFVVDWWFSIGDFLGSLRVVPEVEILGNTVGVKVDRRVSIRAEATITTVDANTVIRHSLPELGKYSESSYVRTCNEHHPYTPLLKLEFKSYLHAVDATALILQDILRKIKRR